MSPLFTSTSAIENKRPTFGVGNLFTTALLVASIGVNGSAMIPLTSGMTTSQCICEYDSRSIDSIFPEYNGSTIVVSGSFDMIAKKSCIDRINSFLSYEIGWNGYDSLKFTKEVTQKAIHLVNICQHIPEIYPIADGRIQFEFEKENGEYLEFELGDTDTLSVYSVDIDGTESDYSVRDNEFARIVAEFYG